MFRRWIISVVMMIMLSLAVGSAVVASQTAQTQNPAIGIKAKKPVLGAACRGCPWGAMAEIVRQAMLPYGYEVQICNNCALPEAPRIVSAAKMPPPWKPSTNPNNPDYLTPKPPNAPVDFGTAASLRVWQAYQGIDDYAGEPPHKNLRLIANLENPNYLAVAVKADSGITDLSQIMQKHMAVRIISQSSPEIKETLAYYGLTEEAVKAAGGSFLRGTSEDLKNADVIIHNAALGNAPEYNIWLEASQKYDLRFLELPSDLLDKLAKDNEIDRGTIPLWLYRGVDRPIATVVQTGNAIYCRADAPDDFVYAVAKALDEQQEVFQWSHLNFYYNIHNVWKDRGLPLHPGAAKYYRERGYMK